MGYAGIAVVALQLGMVFGWVDPARTAILTCAAVALGLCVETLGRGK